MTLHSLGLALYAGALLYAAWNDLLRYQIPNAVVAILVVAFALFATALPWATTLLDVSASLAVLVVTALAFAFRLMGGGDAKLLAVAALWTGWRLLPPLLLVTSIIGAVLALLLLALRRLAPASLPQDRWYSLALARGEGVPYGVAIAVGGLILLPPISAPALP